MDIHICSCCGKIIQGKSYGCKTCESNFCEQCHSSFGESCQVCGDKNF